MEEEKDEDEDEDKAEEEDVKLIDEITVRILCYVYIFLTLMVWWKEYTYITIVSQGRGRW